MSTLSSLSIRRPVLAVVMSLVIVLFGVIGLTRLSVREYPAIDPPIISVVTPYPGADPASIEGQITEPLESEINTTPGIKTLTSTSREGLSTISVEFVLGTDLERAANDVRDRVDRTRGVLPADIEPPIVQKQDANSEPIGYIRVVSDTYDLLAVTDVADNTIAEQLQTIDGVSQVLIYGSKEYTMRLWLDPALMAAYGVTPADIREAVQTQNVELPSGRIEGTLTEFTVRTLGRLETPDEFGDLILRQDGAQIVRLRDVGTVELGPNELRQRARFDGEDMVVLAVQAQSGANQVSVINDVNDRLASILKDVPSGISVEFVYDATQFVRESIAEVIQTIGLAVLLVVLVIFAFLRDWRTTLVPVLVIPVSLVGAFFVMYLLGFSINVLSLLGIVLAIGLVVDDAIVVTENIYAKLEQGMPAAQAGMLGIREIFFAVVATTVALVAVFVPILFISGLVGVLFTEFALTLAGAVIISSFAALTLTPMIATRLLKRRDEPTWLYRVTEPFFERMNGAYARGLDTFLRRRWLAFPAVVVAAGLAGLLFWSLPSELAPLEDRGFLVVFSTGPEGASYEYMDDYNSRFIDLVEQNVPERDFMVTITSPQFGAAGSVNSAIALLGLTPAADRTRTQAEIAGTLQGQVGGLTQASAFVIQPETIQAGGDFGGLPVQFVLMNLDRSKIEAVLPQFLGAVFQNPTFAFAQPDLKFTSPEVNVSIDRERARSLGITPFEMNQALQLALGGVRYDYFLKDGRQYEVVGQLRRPFRDAPIDLTDIYVRTQTGESVPLGNFVEISERGTPPQLFRFNRLPSATVSAALAPGATVGDGVAAMEAIAAQVLDPTFSTALTGPTDDFAESSNSLYFVFGLALILIYLVLAAQFESFRDPATILLTVPLALAGGLLALWYIGQTVNIFSQIGMIMLIGLIAKNGILVVEFANQRRAAGLSIADAVREAAVARFRPILMTSITTILGILPIALALGAGGTSRAPMGTVVIGGLLIGGFVTLFIVPAIYSYFTGPKVGAISANGHPPTIHLEKHADFPSPPAKAA